MDETDKNTWIKLRATVHFPLYRQCNILRGMSEKKLQDETDLSFRFSADRDRELRQILQGSCCCKSDFVVVVFIMSC